MLCQFKIDIRVPFRRLGHEASCLLRDGREYLEDCYLNFEYHTARLFIRLIYIRSVYLCGPGSIVGIAAGYGLDGPVIESRFGEIFRTCPDWPWGPLSFLYSGYRVFPRGKRAAGA